MSPRGLLRALSLCCALFAPLACQTFSGPVRVAPPAEGAPEETWSSTLREHTRRVEVYDHTMRQVDLRATLVTPRLRHAFSRARDAFHGRVAHDVAMDLIALGKRPDEGVDAPMEKGPRAEEQIVIYVAFYAADQAQRDLAASYSIWDVRLARDGVRVKPEEITTVAYSSALKAVFPHADRFDDFYVLRFPLVDASSGMALMQPGATPLELHIESALAKAHVTWTLTMSPNG